MRKAGLGLLIGVLMVGAAWAQTDMWDEWYEETDPVAVTETESAPAAYGLGEGQILGPMWGVPEDAAWWHDYLQSYGVIRTDANHGNYQGESLPYEMLDYYYTGNRTRTASEGQVFGPMWGVPPEAVGLSDYMPYYPYNASSPPPPQEQPVDVGDGPVEEELWYE